ncbi:DUF1835 domain-containing protein, partial [Arenibaculum sp.]|uniref:DUF1835 domain-containing protein n=1 Tax=Arenibaculum sp. TaxID=2865862 RepID=UPI002E15A6E0|nr:DUF1835 domain-containing protein [Arenibaculum sp.]
MTDRTARTRAPFRIDLDQQRKRAKDLYRALRADAPDARARFQAHHPRAPLFDPRLADAQLVVARELGLPSWPRLRAHADALARARAAMRSGSSAPDGDRPTLHLRCGSDIRQTLTEAGFTGDFLEYSDPLCQGPVTRDADLSALRARFIAEAYGAPLGLTETAVAEKLRGEQEGLALAAGQYERVVLWMEHDNYDQLVLVRCLAHFRRYGPPPVLELVSINHFPGSARFIGLGQLPPEAIRMLWARRRAVDAADLEIGQRAWDALRNDDPRALAAVARTDGTGLPDLAAALLRHLHELPWTRDGLSLTERLTLQSLETGSRTIGEAYAHLMRESEPLPSLGDVMFLAVVEAMDRAREPVFTINRTGGPENADL